MLHRKMENILCRAILRRRNDENSASSNPVISVAVSTSNPVAILGIIMLSLGLLAEFVVTDGHLVKLRFARNYQKTKFFALENCGN